MSFYGIPQFVKNLDTLMDCERFKQADDEEQLEMGYQLFFSKFGIGSFLGTGKVQPLETEC